MDNGEDKITCQCGNGLGDVVMLSKLRRLQLGGVVVQAVHGNCSRCGKAFHWSLSEEMMQELIERVLHAREHL